MCFRRLARLGRAPGIALLLWLPGGMHVPTPAQIPTQVPAQIPAKTPVTRVLIGDRAVQRGVKRFGINLSGQNFYDSGQMLRNLVARNPGFEGETWQSVVRCVGLGQESCTIGEEVAWPSGFMDGASYDVATGSGAGSRGTVRTSTRVQGGYRLTFAGAFPGRPGGSRELVLRARKPGDATAGWWTEFTCNSTAVAELHDLPPDSASRQAVRVDAAAPCQRAVLTSYFDSVEGHSFVRLHGPQVLRFQAKPMVGRPRVTVHAERAGTPPFLDKGVALQPGWHAYAVPFQARDRPGSTGTVGLSFRVEGATVLLDDVSLVSAGDARNRTAFRDEVVETLRDLRPGMLRLMDSGTNFGTSLDDWLAPPNGRPRTGYSTRTTEQNDVGLGLHECLELAESVGAEPWISLPAGFSAEEARHLVEYLAGSAQTKYGGVRAALGHRAPWDQVFSTMHLELGNEVWNEGSFAGASFGSAAAYGERAAMVFGAIRTAPGFKAARYDLVAGAWAEMPAHTQQEVRALGAAADAVAIAPYLFSRYEKAPGMEGVYGPMLAEPEQWTRHGGMVARQAEVLRAAGKRLAIYEVNLGTLNGASTISQQAIDRTVPTMGAALATADLMLLMLRDVGVTDQCFFALSEFRNGFTSPGGAGPPRTTPLYGAVVDMGGLTERRRPSFLALRLLNRVVLSTLVETRLDGANPTWDQAASPNDAIALAGAHVLQSFAFAEGRDRSVVLLNLSRTESLPVSFAGNHAPRGAVEQTTLTSAQIEDSNEDAALVAPRTATLVNFDPTAAYRLPPFSITAFTWKTS